MKVLFLIDALAFGGAENTLLTLVQHAEYGAFEPEVAVIATPSAAYSRWLPLFRSNGIEPRFLGIERVRQPDALPRVVRAIRRSGADVVHAHLGTASTFAPVAARLAGRHALCTLHTVAHLTDPGDVRRERLSVEAASRSSGLLFVSHAALDSFARRYRPRPRTWAVVRNGVDIDRFHPATPDERRRARTSLGVPEHGLVAVHVGELRRRKGQDISIDAWTAVIREHPDAHLVFVGDGPEAGPLRDHAARAGLAERIVFTGARGDVPAILHGADLLIHPTEMDALPTVLIEAAAAGIPVVSTRVDGVPEVVVHDETGWLMDSPTPGRLSATVLAAFGDRARLVLAGEAGRRRAEKHFDARDWAHRMGRLYAAAATGRPVTSVPMGDET